MRIVGRPARVGRGNSVANSSKSSRGTVTAGASAAGVGGGTLLVLYANSLPDSSHIKFWLVLAAPSVSVFLGVIWLWLRVEIANYVQGLKVRSIARAAKATLQEALANPSTSEEHKSRIRSRLEEVEMLLSDHQMKRIRAISTVTIHDLQALDAAVKAEQSSQ